MDEVIIVLRGIGFVRIFQWRESERDITNIHKLWKYIDPSIIDRISWEGIIPESHRAIRFPSWVADPRIDDSIERTCTRSLVSPSEIFPDETEHLNIADTSGSMTGTIRVTRTCHSGRSKRILLDIPTKKESLLENGLYHIEFFRTEKRSSKRRSISKMKIVIITLDPPISVLISSIIILIRIVVPKLLFVLSVSLECS